MATVRWLGLQGVTRKVYRWTVNASVGDTYTLTHNLKTVSYTAVTGDTTADVAAGLVAAVQASPEPEFQELEASSNAAVLSITGPDDGATVTVTASVSGSATMTAGTTTAPVSPYDVGDGANYSSGSLPANNDTLVIPTGSADMRYNLEALSAITGLTIVREIDGPVIGLPDYRATNYREYRPTRLKVPAPTVRINLSQQEDGPIRLNLHSTNAAITVNQAGAAGRGNIGAEAIDIIGTAANSTLAVNGSSVVVAPAYTDTGTITTLTADNSTIRVGRGATLTNAELNGCEAEIGCNWTGLTVDDGGLTTITGTATGALTANGGTVNWNSTGTLTNPIIGVGVTLDLSGASGAVAVSGAIARHAGSTINDPGSRITVPYDVQCIRCGVEGLTLGKHRTVTVDAGP
jgi:hypothetical protein